MSSTYFIGDLHFGHKNICKYRKIEGITSTEEHDEYMFKKVLSVSGKRNTLILLGDCFFTKDSLKYLREFRKAFGKVILILGNHDTDSPERIENIKIIIKEDLVDEIHGLLKYKGF